MLWLLLTMATPLFAQTVSTNHYDTLKNSRWFAISGGFANATTPESYAVAAICEQTNATSTFQRLLQEPAPAQQLYGLLGLHLIKAGEFKAALPSLLISKAKVRVLMGCIAGERDVAEVARQIQNNQWRLRVVPVPGGKYASAVVEH